MNTQLSLQDCILLDSVQKGRAITPEARKYLRSKHLIEGTGKMCRISADVARMTNQLPDYTRARGLDKPKIHGLIIQLLNSAEGEGVRKQVIFDTLVDVLPKKDIKLNRYVGNILSAMKKNGMIINRGQKWYVVHSTKND